MCTGVESQINFGYRVQTHTQGDHSAWPTWKSSPSTTMKLMKTGRTRRSRRLFPTRSTIKLCTKWHAAVFILSYSPLMAACSPSAVMIKELLVARVLSASQLEWNLRIPLIWLRQAIIIRYSQIVITVLSISQATIITSEVKRWQLQYLNPHAFMLQKF